MPNYLVIVESPAKAKTIKKYLGKNYKVEASMGHIRDLPKSKIAVDVENNFEPQYITIRGKGDLIAKLKKVAKKADKVFLATDPDREGEAISWHLAHLLNIDEKNKCRITFNEITKNAVKKAIEKPTQIDMRLVDAQQARRILDRLVGYTISPLLWKKVKKGLSAGRVQSVATRIICEREEEIEKFVQEEYWSLIADMQTDKKERFQAKFYGDKNQKISLSTKDDVEKIIQQIQNKPVLVSKVKKSEKRKHPMAPFITSTLQQEAHRKLGFATKKTMMVAQQLYEGVEIQGQGSLGLVTYIRTDSTRISDDALEGVRGYIREMYGEKYLQPEPRIFKNKSSSQDAHEAIRPSYIELTPEELANSLTKDQYKLYKLIWTRFIASQMTPSVYDTVNVEMNCDAYVFRATGSKIKFQGFLSVYAIEKETAENEDEEANTNIPELNEGESLSFQKLLPKQHFTQPPARYTEASLVRALEERGIGRPSTYAPTINTVLVRGYVERKQKMLYPTELGVIVNGIMRDHFESIVDVDFTVQMEKDLDGVEEGEKQWKEILQQFYGGFEQDLKKAEVNIEQVKIKDQEAGILCDKCGRMMVIKLGRKGKKFIACPGFPECRNALPIMQPADANCPKCKGKLYYKESKKGRQFLGCENYPQCDFVSWDKPTENKCPECGHFLFEKMKAKMTHMYCSNDACTHGKESFKKEAKESSKKEEKESSKKEAKETSKKEAKKSSKKEEKESSKKEEKESSKKEAKESSKKI